MRSRFTNPFRPGAGHMPPYLAGRQIETEEFARLLRQETILENLVLTGLRGVGKTVLLETLKPLATDEGWLWIGTDLSESSSVTEVNLSIRLLTDLSVITSTLLAHTEIQKSIGFNPAERQVQYALDFATLSSLFQSTPGLVSDKLKAVLEMVWNALRPLGKRGIIF